MGATYFRRGKSFRITVAQGGQRATITVRSKADAESLCREIRRQELTGVNIVAAMRKARVPDVAAPSAYPTLKQAVLDFIDGQLKAGELRESTAESYRNRCKVWLFPKLGDTPVDQVTREQIGGVIRAIREAGKSSAIRRGVVNPVRGFYTHMIETKTLPGPNPAADLKWFIGKHAIRKQGDAPFFTPDEGQKIMEAFKVAHPRWHGSVAAAFMSGLRFGELAALWRTDLDVKRGLLTVQRGVSRGEVAPTKTGKIRHVKVSPALLGILVAHLEAMELDAQAGDWPAESRRLMFPTTHGGMMRYRYFIEKLWRPTLRRLKIVLRRFHSTRHSYAAWLLSAGADVRFVADQLGHARITLTMDLYGRHIQRSQHEHHVAALDKYLLAE